MHSQMFPMHLRPLQWMVQQLGKMTCPIIPARQNACRNAMSALALVFIYGYDDARRVCVRGVRVRCSDQLLLWLAYTAQVCVSSMRLPSGCRAICLHVYTQAEGLPTRTSTHTHSQFNINAQRLKAYLGVSCYKL